MSKKYNARRMTEREIQALEQMLLEQMEIQVWYRVEFLLQLGGETFIMVQ